MLGLAYLAGLVTMWFFRSDLERVVASLTSGSGVVAVEPADPRKERAELLWEIWDILEREYIDPTAIQIDHMIHGAAAGMVASLGDPPTVFVEPVSATILNDDMQGSFEGIGATVDMVEGRLVIVRPLPNSPALKAGLKAGDVILAVNGESLEAKSLMAAISMIRGPRGTVVRLLVERKGVEGPFIVPVTRDKVELPIIETHTLEGHVAYLHLSEFNAVAPTKVRDALDELLAQDPKGLILDLRGNPGGFLQSAVEVAGEFLPRGTLILTEQERDKPIREFRVKRLGLATRVPLVVLVDGSSASASEIVAGAIQESKRGILVGSKTYGKGSVQNTHSLRDGSSLRVTVAKWYLPSGRNLDGNGLDPDLPVERTPEDVAAERDPQLDAAVAYLLSAEKVADAP